MKQALVSVIIPTFQRSEFLSRAIDSVLNQTYKNIEIIVVDDNDGENEYREATRESIRTFLENDFVNYVCLEKNYGVCYARNIGMKNSNGEYIAFLDDDDVWENKKIELQIKSFQLAENPNLGLIYSAVKIITTENGKSKIQMPKIRSDIFSDLLFENHIGTLSSIVIKREVYLSGIQFDTFLPARNDLDFYLQVALKYSISFVSEVLVTKYEGSSNTISSNLNKRLTAWEFFFNKYEKFYNHNNKAAGRYYLGWGHLKIKNLEFFEGEKLLIKGLKIYPLNLNLISKLIVLNVFGFRNYIKLYH